MINKKRKRSLMRTFAFALSLAMLLLLCPVIHAEADDVTTYDVGTYKGDKASTEWTYPTQEGKIFAGWYTDETYKTVYTKTSGTAYAKFVDDNVLVVKKQLNSGVSYDSETANIRFLTAIDSLAYFSVTFHVAMPATDKQWTMTERNACSSVLVDGVTYPYTAEQVFGAGAAYFVVHSLTGIPQSAFDNEIQISVSWRTLDGTDVMVAQPSFSVKEEIDYAIKITSGCTEADCDGIYGHNGICSANDAHYQAAVYNETDSVYEISNAGQLFWFAAKVNSGDHKIDGILMKDIDLENREWTPIGNFDGKSGSGYTTLTDTSKMDTTTDAYRGSFDGNGKTISGLKLTATTDANSNVGLFGLVIGGKIQNFTVNGEIQIAVTDAEGRIGVIGQCDYTTVSGIESSVNITVADGVAKSCYVAGVVGDCQRCSTVEKCVWYGAINAGTCTSGSFGGIVGRTGPSTITNCASYGTMQGTTSKNLHLHGIVGFANHVDIKISNCLFAGTMDAKGEHLSAVANVVNHTLANYSNLYYAEGSADYAILCSNSSTSDAAVALAGKVTALTQEQLTGGGAVLLLNGGDPDGIWMLDTFTINGTKCKLPGFDGEPITGIVCNEAGCEGNYKNGFCSANSAHYQEPELVDGVYEISNGGQLFSFAAMVNAGNAEVTRFKAKLTKDINLDNRPWTPIGTEANPFVGTFDGNGKTISGLNLTTTGAAHEGLFGYVISSTVKNFTVDGGITIDVSKTADEGNLGVIGYAGNGTIIQNITSYVGIAVNEAVTNGAYQYVGGIVGNFDSGLLEKCIWDGVIDEGNWTINRFAGIAGRMGVRASITNTASYGTLKSKNANADLAGIVGWANNPGGIRSSLFAGELLYEGKGTVNYIAIASVGDSCTADKLTDLYYVNGTGYVAGTPDAVFSNATPVTFDEAFSRSMVWKLNGKKSSGNWRYNTDNQRPEFEGESVTSG